MSVTTRLAALTFVVALPAAAPAASAQTVGMRYDHPTTDANYLRKAAFAVVAHERLTLFDTMARAGVSWAPPRGAPARQRT